MRHEHANNFLPTFGPIDSGLAWPFGASVFFYFKLHPIMLWSRPTTPADLEPPAWLWLRVGSGWSGATCKILLESDHEYRQEVLLPSRPAFSGSR